MIERTATTWLDLAMDDAAVEGMPGTFAREVHDARCVV